jgi:hypothetical protein
MSVAQQNARFKQALANKEITQAQYNQAMAYQNKQTQPQTTTPMPPEYWSQPTKPVTNLELAKQEVQTKATSQQYTARGGTSNPLAGKLVLTGKTQTGALGIEVPIATRSTGPAEQSLTPQEQASLSQWKEEQTRNTMLITGGVVAFGAIAPVVAPVAFPLLTVKGVAIGAALGVGVEQGMRFVPSNPITGDYRGTWLTPTEIATAGVTGAAFSVVGGAIMGGAAKVAPRLIGSTANPFIRGVSRIGVNAGIGAGGGAIMSGGNIDAAKQGALFGAAFGAVGEGVGAVAPKIPLIKYGNVKIPMQNQETVYWKGLYLSKESYAKPLIGKTSTITKGTRVAGIVGETPTFRPQTNIESEITRKVMMQTGTPKEIIAVNREAVDVTNIAKGVKKPKLFEDFLPRETKTSTVEEVSQLKNYIIENDKIVEKVFGKFGAKPQESKSFSYEITNAKGETVSSARTTTDIDIQLKAGVSQIEVERFSKGIFDIYSKNPKAKATLKGSLIETVPTELRGSNKTKLAHAVDIHSDFDTILNNTGQVSKGKTWGINIAEKPRSIEKIPTASLREQVGGKLQSIMDITPEGKFGPVPHRTKDIPDFLHDARTLIEQRKNPVVRNKGMKELQDISDYFGLGDITKIKGSGFKVEEYNISQPTSFTVKNSLFVIPSLPGSTNNKKGSGSSKGSLPSSRSYSLPSKTSVSSLINMPSFNPKVSTPSKIEQYNVRGFPSIGSVPNPSKPSPSQPYSPGPSIPTYPVYPSPKPYYPNYPKTPNIPSFGLGGGFDRLNPNKSLRGNWMQKKHKIKTYSQMLQTFGVGKAAKPMRSVDKALSKHINKLDRKLIKKSIRRTKR